jgi:hypothetical protein
MAYQIQYAEESDAPSLAQINTLSFQGRGLLSQVFPETTQDALEAYKSMYTMKHLANPQMHVHKVADPASGTIVGYARWHIPESLAPRTDLPVLSEKAQEAARDPFQFAPRPMNEALMAGFRGLLEESRKKHVTEKDMSKASPDCLRLDLCFVAVMINMNSAGPACNTAVSPRAWDRVNPLAMGYNQGR